MPAATLQMPASDSVSPHATSGDDHVLQASPAAWITGDGKTLHQETLDSARAAGIAVLIAAAMMLAIIAGIVMLLLG